MGINTNSAFNYGHVITKDNQYIDFSENGVDEIFALVEIGSYTLGTFLDAVLTALNNSGANEYTGNLDRLTNKITIISDNNFTLLPVSGSHSAISAFELMGFTLDESENTSFTGQGMSGFQYVPQFKLQNYVDFKDNVKTNQSSVKESASGLVEVVSFGKNYFMDCEITLATNNDTQSEITYNGTGVEDLRAFMNFIINKYNIEFVYDVLNPDIFEPMILESTQKSRNGTDFILYEMYSKRLKDFYETKKITFRKIN